MKASLVPIAAAALVCASSARAAAQWINYPTPGIPRLPDGKPNLSAPAPRTPEGNSPHRTIFTDGRPLGPGQLSQQ